MFPCQRRGFDTRCRQVVEAPQRSPPVLDGSGQFAIYQESNHSLTTHETSAATLVLDTQSGETTKLPSEGKSFVWVEPGRDVMWQKTVDDTTELWICEASNTSAQ